MTVWSPLKPEFPLTDGNLVSQNFLAEPDIKDETATYSDVAHQNIPRADGVYTACPEWAAVNLDGGSVVLSSGNTNFEGRQYHRKHTYSDLSSSNQGTFVSSIYAYICMHPFQRLMSSYSQLTALNQRGLQSTIHFIWTSPFFHTHFAAGHEAYQSH